VKELLILRHSIAVPGDARTPDFERPLTPHGHVLAETVGVHLRHQQLLPDLVLCSTATRTRATLRDLMHGAEWEAPVFYEDDFYHGGSQQVLDQVALRAKDANRVLIVGHNPTVSELIRHLADSHVHMQPATLARLVLELEAWRELSSFALAQLDGLWPAQGG